VTKERMTTMRVLLVDDVAQVRHDLCTILTLTEGIEIVGEASNGQEAINLVKTLHPDVVLLDLEMPVMDGQESTRHIKALDPSCRIIMLTVHGDSEVEQRALQAGIDSFIVKGAPIEDLIRAVLDKKE